MRTARTRPREHHIAAKIDAGGGAMPPQLLTGSDRDMVARYVAEQAER